MKGLKRARHISRPTKMFNALRNKLLILFLAVLFIPAAVAVATGQWREILLSDYHGRLFYASSELKSRAAGGFGPYSPKNLFDGRTDTCWAEGSPDDGRGQSLIFDLPDGTEKIAIANGYQKSPRLFAANNRVAAITATILLAVSRPGELTETRTLFHTVSMSKNRRLNLKDQGGFQEFTIITDTPALNRFRRQTMTKFRQQNPGTTKLTVRTLVRLRIKKTFPGSRYNDTCISEIKFLPPARAVTRAYLSQQEDAILIDSAAGRGAVLVRDPESIFQILAIDKGRHFLVAIRMAAAASPRSETRYELYDLDHRRMIPRQELGAEVGDMYDLETKDGQVFLSYLNSRTMEIEELDLDRFEK